MLLEQPKFKSYWTRISKAYDYVSPCFGQRKNALLAMTCYSIKLQLSTLTTILDFRGVVLSFDKMKFLELNIYWCCRGSNGFLHIDRNGVDWPHHDLQTLSSNRKLKCKHQYIFYVHDRAQGTNLPQCDVINWWVFNCYIKLFSASIIADWVFQFCLNSLLSEFRECWLLEKVKSLGGCLWRFWCLGVLGGKFLRVWIHYSFWS